MYNSFIIHQMFGREGEDKSCGGAAVESRQVLCFKMEDVCPHLCIREERLKSRSEGGL